jgi:hypothetical protein
MAVGRADTEGAGAFKPRKSERIREAFRPGLSPIYETLLPGAARETN